MKLRQPQNKDKISAIIVNYNGRKWLDKLFSSLQNQTYTNIELLFVDNDSQDDSVDFILKNYPQVKVIRSKNLGYGHACNIGSKNANGKYLMFFNEDMFVENDFCGRFVDTINAIDDKNKVGTIGCVLANYDKSYIPVRYGFTVDLMAIPTMSNRQGRILYNTGCPFFIDKETFHNAGGFCENIFLYSEDVDLCWRLKLMGYEHYFINDTLLYHYGGGVVGGYSPHKLSNYIKGEFISVYNNASWVLLPISLLGHTLFYLLLSILYLLIGKFNYTKAILRTEFIEIPRKLSKFHEYRRFVQSRRIVSDFILIKYFSILPSRVKNLFVNSTTTSYE